LTSQIHGTVLIVFAGWRQPHKNSDNHVRTRPCNSSSIGLMLYKLVRYIAARN